MTHRLAEDAPIAGAAPARAHLRELLPRWWAAAAAGVALISIVLVVAGAPTGARLDALSPKPLVRAMDDTARWLATRHGLRDIVVNGVNPVVVAVVAFLGAVVSAGFWRWRACALVLVAPLLANEVAERVMKQHFGGGYPSGHATGVFALGTVAAVLLIPRRRLAWWWGLSRAVVVVLLVAVCFVLASGVVVSGAHSAASAVGGALTAAAVASVAALAIDVVSLGLNILRRTWGRRAGSSSGGP